MVLATAISVTALGTVLGAYGIVQREMPRSFVATTPASATLVTRAPIDDQVVTEARHRAGVVDAQARALISLRAEVEPEQWLPLSVFAIPSFVEMRIET